MWISSVWYSFRRSRADLIAKIRTYEKDNCHQPAAYPWVLPNPAIINLDRHDIALNQA
jgi:hypothetical protein